MNVTIFAEAPELRYFRADTALGEALPQAELGTGLSLLSWHVILGPSSPRKMESEPWRSGWSAHRWIYTGNFEEKLDDWKVSVLFAARLAAGWLRKAEFDEFRGKSGEGGFKRKPQNPQTKEADVVNWLMKGNPALQTQFVSTAAEFPSASRRAALWVIGYWKISAWIALLQNLIFQTTFINIMGCIDNKVVFPSSPRLLYKSELSKHLPKVSRRLLRDWYPQYARGDLVGCNPITNSL